MTYAYQSWPQQPRRRGLSGVALTLIIGGVALGAALFAVLLVVLADLAGGEQEPQEPPTAEVVACEVDGQVATVQWSVTNNGDRQDSFEVTITVEDADGRQVGDATRRNSRVEPGVTVTDSTWMILDAEGGQTCHVTAE